MKILFEEIVGKNHHITTTDNHWLPNLENGRILSAKAELLLSRLDEETILVRGEVTGYGQFLCDRCSDQFQERLINNFKYLVTTKKEEVEQAEHEISDAEAEILYVATPAIDVDAILQEQMLLMLPVKKLCKEDCKGICPCCGAVLAMESCRCVSGELPSPFAILKKLKD